MPGLELTYLVNEHWEIRPFFEIGGGRDFSASETFAQTHFGVRSLHKNELRNQWTLRTGLALRWAGEYQFKSEDTTGFGVVDAGLDLRRDLPWMLFDRPLDMGAYYIYSRFLPRLNLARADDWDGEPRDLHEVGLSLGLQKVRKILGFSVSRVRVGYKTGADFQGWTIGTDFPF